MAVQEPGRVAGMTHTRRDDPALKLVMAALHQAHTDVVSSPDFHEGTDGRCYVCVAIEALDGYMVARYGEQPPAEPHKHTPKKRKRR